MCSEHVIELTAGRKICAICLCQRILNLSNSCWRIHALIDEIAKDEPLTHEIVNRAEIRINTINDIEEIMRDMTSQVTKLLN